MHALTGPVLLKLFFNEPKHLITFFYLLVISVLMFILTHPHPALPPPPPLQVPVHAHTHSSYSGTKVNNIIMKK
jgi:hypothetical protein